MKIRIVSPDILAYVISTREPRGLFLCHEDVWWIAVDNSTGDAWTEEFESRSLAEQWLRGEFEIFEQGTPA